MKIDSNGIIVQENKGLQLEKPSRDIITDYQKWVYSIHPIIPTAKAAWDFQSNQVAYMESLIKDAAITIKGLKQILEDLKVMHEELIQDNYKQEVELKTLRGEHVQ